MNDGFFSSSIVGRTKGMELVAKCGACKLHESCGSPKMEVDGDGELGLMIVGEAPGKDEDRAGRPFVGRSGERLAKSLKRCGVSMRRDCHLTNALICRPGLMKSGSVLNPTSRQVEHCRANVVKAMRELKPRVILLTGNAPVRSVLGHIWKEDLKGITRWAGWSIPCRTPDVWIVPTFHPSYVIREDDKPTGPMVNRVFDAHVALAVELARRGRTPWDGNPPDERKLIEVIHSPKEAARAIRKGMDGATVTSFDYETNKLKPEDADADLVSCSICFDGKRTIAFPMLGRAVDAVREYLTSDLPKVGAMMKFEHRWSRAKLGVTVRRWIWDVVQQAHVLDHRRGITSVKFQSFVRDGVPSYDERVRPYLKSKGPRIANRIREVDIDELLIYNGIDSLVEMNVAVKQAERFGLNILKGEGL